MTARVSLPAPIRDGRLLVILRGLPEELARRALETLAGCGVRAVEVTVDSPAATDLVATARRHGMLAGSGTIRGVGDAARALRAGASFLVCPHVDEALLRWCANREVPVLAGAATPTEALRAWKAGAAAVKLFPAGPLGVDYLRALRDPLPDVPFVPTGGIGVEAAPEWLEAGAVAVAVGGAIGRAAREGTLEPAARELVASTTRAREPV